MTSDNGERFKQRGSKSVLDKARKWFEEHFEQLQELGKDGSILQGVIFGPLCDLLNSFGNTTEDQVKRTITQVALVNAVLAGLPGKLGVGVAVSLALEAWMAYRIASHTGVKINAPTDVFKYIGVGTGVLVAILWGFVHALRAVFSVLSILPLAIPATFTAELITTNFFGVLFWLAFKSAGNDEKFGWKTLAGLAPKASDLTYGLVKYQLGMVKHVASRSPTILKRTGQRLWIFLTGDRQAVEDKRRRGEILATAGLAHLLQGRTEVFDGPLGAIFLQSIRDRWADLDQDSTVEDIAEFMRSKDYTDDGLEGTIHMLKGKMFEHLVAKYENANGDEWIAHLHSDESFPGSDIVLTNTETGQEIELSLKTTDNPALIENALLRYPDVPIITTSEMAEYYADDSRVTTSDWNDEELERIARGNWDNLAREAAGRWDTTVNVTGSSVCVRLALLWPTVVQYLRGKISSSELEERLYEEMGDAGVVLAKRVTLSAALGPVYVWYLLARGILELIPDPEKDNSPLHLEYRY